MTDIRFSRAAQADMLEIWNYLFEKGPRAASMFSQSILSQMNLLREHPLAGRERPEAGHAMRSLAAGKYVVFYRVETVHLEVARVIHGARDLGAIFPLNGQDAE